MVQRDELWELTPHTGYRDKLEFSPPNKPTARWQWRYAWVEGRLVNKLDAMNKKTHQRSTKHRSSNNGFNTEMKRGSCHHQIFTGMCKNVCMLINFTVNTCQTIDMSERPSNHSVSGFSTYYLHSFTVNTGHTDHQSILITGHCFLCETTSVLKSMILTKLQLPFYFSSVWDGGRWKEKEEDWEKKKPRRRRREFEDQYSWI